MKIVIVGGGAAGFKAAEAMRKEHPAAEILIVDKQKTPWNRYALSEWLTGMAGSSVATLCDRDKTDLRLELMQDKAVRINFDRKKIFFKNQPAQSFDKLVVCCGLKPAREMCKGGSREGVFVLDDCDPFELRTSMDLYPHVVVSVRSWYGLRVACAVARYPHRDVSVVLARTDFLRCEDLERVKAYFVSENVAVYDEDAVEEVIGEGRMKAVRLSSRKFIAADTLVLDCERIPNLELFKETPEVVMDGWLRIDGHLRIGGYEDVYACGDMINPCQIHDRAGEMSQRMIAEESAVISAALGGTMHQYDCAFYCSQISPDYNLARVLGVELPEPVGEVVTTEQLTRETVQADLV
jgi:NAD(P)H-nitrite reductase large subunit